MNLKLILLSRILNDIYPDTPISDFYTVTYDSYSRPQSYSWIHPTIIEPTQVDLDAEKDVYYLEEVRGSLSILSSRLSISAIPTLESGDYSNTIWSDDTEAAANEALKVLIQSEIDALVVAGQDTTGKLVELAAVPAIVIEAKPTYAEMVAEYEALILEREAAEDVRIVEFERVADIKARWEALHDVRTSLNSVGVSIPNTALELKRIIDGDDQVALSALEVADVAGKALIDSLAWIEQRKDAYPSTEELIIALWENDPTTIAALEAAGQQVKSDIPKPV